MSAGIEEVVNWEELNKIIDAMRKYEDLQVEAEEKLLSLRISNAKKVYDAMLEYENRRAAAEIQHNTDVTLQLIKRGADQQLIALRQAKQAAEAEKEARIAAADDASKAAIEAEYDARIASIDAETNYYVATHTEAAEDLADAEETINKRMLKKLSKEAQNLGKQTFGNMGDVLFGSVNGKMDELKDSLSDLFTEAGLNLSEEQIEKAAKKLQFAAAIDALADWAKKFEQTMTDVAAAQTEIDTRLQGSDNRKWWGSYWKAMSQDIVQKVGMNPMVKQADVVASLKTLVGQGIAFNVEQRAFLDTISDKIATTFEATDATLLKLVRIQQADSTAARLGMESALTAFLNNMYETTEYMQSAAASIRSQLYEAQALMGVAEGAAFEYQVQKWLGSLYSVGFSNAENIAGALGKLAAGDLSSISDNGIGNLLIMAANRSNLSIAEILANGLDDSETNQLMQAMVKYLADIYSETRNSKVIAQQYAAVYGLTASDLKAAASLAPSISNITRNNLSYMGMITQLQNMAGSMGERISVGQMAQNLMDNLKFAIGWTMGENPILNLTYSIANILSDTVGGIDIPLPLVMGSGMNYKLNVADLMRVASMSGGILGGLGTMIAGLFTGKGANILSNFGIGSGTAYVSRGTGQGLLTTSSASISESGSYAGNEDAGDISGKVLGDAKEDAANQVSAAQEDSQETKLSTVDDHIVAIYRLLTDITLGTEALYVVSKEGNGIH